MNENKIGGKRLGVAIIDQIIFIIINYVTQLIVFNKEIFDAFKKVFNGKKYTFSNTYYYGCMAITIIVLIILFSIIPMLNKNRATIGKMMFSLKVVKKNGKKPNIINMICRNIRLWLMIFVDIFLLLAIINSNNALLITYNVLLYSQYIIYIYLIVVIGINKTAFHDLLGKTMVVSNKNIIINKEEQEETEEYEDVFSFPNLDD